MSFDGYQLVALLMGFRSGAGLGISFGPRCSAGA